MSGFICPECSGTYFKTVGKELQCELCGRTCENDGSRAWLTNEGSDENARRHAAVKAGKLFVFRIHLKGPDGERSDTISKTMELLGITGMSGSDGKEETKYKAEISSRPSNDVIEKIRKLKTVKMVSVWP